MRNIACFLFLLFSFGTYSQEAKVNFKLKAEIEKYKNETHALSIIVRGDVGRIVEEVLALEGKVGLSFGNFVQVKLSSNLISDFSKKPFVESIEYAGGQTRVLNDTLLINNNVGPAHSGDVPLISSYTGKGVLFGLIDTGIDIDHADFKDSLGNSRIRILWDQREMDNGTSAYGYGAVSDSVDLHFSLSNHEDDFQYKGHGTHVAGIAVGNGLAVGNYRGIAPDANIAAVAVDFTSSESTILDAVDYIFKVADALNMPCVINASLGSYDGSHDGTDGVAIMIDSLVNAKPGRAFVCSAGNEGDIAFHVQHQVNLDTTFTWFKYNPSSSLGYGAVFCEAWADTTDLNKVNFAVGANLSSGSFGFRGSTPFSNIKSRLGLHTDTIKNNGNVIAIVDTYGELQGDKYLLQIHLKEPDSSAYNFSLMTTGSGKLDIWSDAKLLRTSNIVKSGLPSPSVYPNIIYYAAPDTAQTIVGSYACLPSVLTVGTYVNRKTYLDVDSTIQVTPDTPGEIDIASSIGPSRKDVIKPDIASTGRNVMSATPDDVATYYMSASRHLLAFGGKHSLKSGTSMSSPAVAGIVALYLEKCPSATMAEIKSAILSSAKNDAFTGVTPNNSYGYGKSDAFAALNTSNYDFTIGADQTIADGDSVQISSPPYTSYQWSTGETTRNIYVDTNTSVHVLVTNASGCKALSDTVTVSVLPVGIEEVGDDLFSLYPNPTAGKLLLNLSGVQVNTVSVINLLGKIVYERDGLKERQLVIDISNFSDGVYYVRLNTDSKQYLQKVILQH